jgi:DNA invertase Pin-like site-specific DNA recombinase
MLAVMGAIHEFDRVILKERQREGIALAKKRGAFKGRKKSLSQAEVAEVRQRIANGRIKAQVAREFGISRQTLYQYLKEDEGTPWAR